MMGQAYPISMRELRHRMTVVPLSTLAIAVVMAVILVLQCMRTPLDAIVRWEHERYLAKLNAKKPRLVPSPPPV